MVALKMHQKDHLILKRIKYGIRLGEPNRPMSISPKRVEPILCVGPWHNEDPDLPTTFQKTWSTRMKFGLQGWGLLYKDEAWSTKMKLGLQGWSLVYKDEAYSTRMRLVLQGWDLLHKERRQDLTTIKRLQHPHKRVRVTNSSLAL